MAILVIFFGHFSFGKTAIPPSILARTQNPSITINMFRKLKHDVSFVDLGQKLRVVALLSRHSPKMAKIQEEPWKTTRTSEMKKNRSRSNGKIVALGVLVICIVDKNRSPKKNTFGPKYQNFWGQNLTFLALAAPPVNVFNTKEVSYWFPKMGVPKVVLPPKKITMFGPTPS